MTTLTICRDCRNSVLGTVPNCPDCLSEKVTHINDFAEGEAIWGCGCCNAVHRVANEANPQHNYICHATNVGTSVDIHHLPLVKNNSVYLCQDCRKWNWIALDDRISFFRFACPDCMTTTQFKTLGRKYALGKDFLHPVVLGDLRNAKKNLTLKCGHQIYLAQFLFELRAKDKEILQAAPGTDPAPSVITSELTFTCDKCEQAIVIDESGAGQTVACPHCGQPVTVPNRHIIVNDQWQETYQELTKPSADKKCPFCKAIITDVNFCGFCGYDLVNGNPPPSQPAGTAGSKASRHFSRLVIGLAGLAIVVIGIFVFKDLQGRQPAEVEVEKPEAGVKKAKAVKAIIEQQIAKSEVEAKAAAANADNSDLLEFLNARRKETAVFRLRQLTKAFAAKPPFVTNSTFNVSATESHSTPYSGTVEFSLQLSQPRLTRDCQFAFALEFQNERWVLKRTCCKCTWTGESTSWKENAGVFNFCDDEAQPVDLRGEPPVKENLWSLMGIYRKNFEAAMDSVYPKKH